MRLYEKLYTLIIFSAVICGILLSKWEFIQFYAEQAILPLLIIMLYITFLQLPLSHIKSAFFHKKFTYTSLGINFIWTPILAAILGYIFLQQYPVIFIGFIMLMVTPCTDWYIIFTSIARGNTALSVAILPINLVLQLLLLPVYLFIFSGAVHPISFLFLVKHILLVILLPLSTALFTKLLLKKYKVDKQHVDKLDSFPILLLSLAIIAMFTSQGHILLENIHLLWILFIPVSLFFIINFFVTHYLGQICQLAYPDRVSLSFTSLARNSPIALAIAMTAFIDQPLIALTLIIGPLLELPILAFIAQIHLLIKRRFAYHD